jgi:fluoride ion exporter CrcB/FEX
MELYAIVDTALYVVYLATLTSTLRWLVYNDEGKSVRKQIDWKMLTVTIVTFLLITMLLVLDVLDTPRMTSFLLISLDNYTVRLFNGRPWRDP